MSKSKRVWLTLVFLLIFNGGYASISHFKDKEFACHHCGKVLIANKLQRKLELLRSIIDKPIIITSGYHCKIHNKLVGGVKNSQHLYGKAADIKVKGLSPYKLSLYAKKIGFGYIKTYSGWIHVDVR